LWLRVKDYSRTYLIPLIFLLLLIIIISGSTGKPKGVLHTTGGYLLYAATTFKYVFDYQPGDVYWCTADIGWITGHSYVVYGPLANGATSVIVSFVLFNYTIFILEKITIILKIKLSKLKIDLRTSHKYNTYIIEYTYQLMFFVL